MKKEIVETQTFCDYCQADELAGHRCLLCGRDICLKHTLGLSMETGHQHPGFSAYLCPTCSYALLDAPIQQLTAVSGTWEQIGYNPEYNMARLHEILSFINSK